MVRKNLRHPQNQSDTVCFFLLWVLIGLWLCKPLLWLIAAITLVMVFKQSIVNCTNIFRLSFFTNQWHFCHTDMHIKWERSNLEKYVLFDKKKWRYSDQHKDGMLNRQEYEYFHHPKEHEIMLPYIAVVSKPVFLVWFSWFDTLTSVCTFSILFSIHFISCWQVEFIYQSRPSLAGDRFLYSRDLNMWFSCDIVRRNWMQVTFRDQRVKTSLRNQAIHTNAIVFSKEILDRYDKDEDGRLSLDEYLGKWFR